MKGSTIALIAGAGLLVYALSKSSGPQQSSSPGATWQPDSSGAINPYTMGYNPSAPAGPTNITVNVPPIVVNDKPIVPESPVNPGQKSITPPVLRTISGGTTLIPVSQPSTKLATKVAVDLFTKPQTQYLAPGSAEDYAVAQNYARGLVGTKNATGGYTYKL